MRKIILAMTLLGMAGTASADFLGLYVGGGSWSHDPEGGFSSTNLGSTTIDMKNNLGFDKESEGYLWAAFDHPIPLLPNIRLERTALKHEGVTSSVNFLGTSVQGPAVVEHVTAENLVNVLLAVAAPQQFFR